MNEAGSDLPHQQDRRIRRAHRPRRIKRGHPLRIVGADIGAMPYQQFGDIAAIEHCRHRTIIQLLRKIELLALNFEKSSVTKNIVPFAG